MGLEPVVKPKAPASLQKPAKSTAISKPVVLTESGFTERRVSQIKEYLTKGGYDERGRGLKATDTGGISIRRPDYRQYYDRPIGQINPNTSMSDIDRWWNPNKGKGEFWQSPQRVARYYQLIQNAPKGWTPPDWLDTKTVTALYNYYSDNNKGAPWYSWGMISDQDPAMSVIKGMQLPPPEMLFKGEEIYGAEAMAKRRQELADNNPTANMPDWNDLEKWQQWSLGLFSPQPMANRPEWTRAAPINAILQGLGGAAVGTAIAPGPGTVVGFMAGVGTSLYTNLTGEKIPLLSDMLMAFNKPAEWTEQTIGVIKQAIGEDWSFDELVDNFPEAWRAAQQTYEAYGGPGQELLNLAATLAGDQPAPEGYAWDLLNAQKEPVKIQGPQKLYALTQARERIQDGEDATQVYLDMVDNYGYGGTLNDFIMQSVIDPMQFANLAQSAGLKALGDQFPQLRLAKVAEATSGRWYIDALPIGVQNAVQGAMKLVGADPSSYKQSGGVLGTFSEYKRWIQEGGWPDGMPVKNRADLPAFEKWLGGLDNEGLPKQLAATPDQKGIMGYIKSLSQLDAPSKVFAVSDITNKNVGQMLSVAKDTAEIRASIGKIAGLNPVEAGQTFEGMIKSPEVGIVQAPIKDFVDTGKMDTMLAEYEGVATQRALLETIAVSLKKTTGEVLEMIKKTPDEAARIISKSDAATAVKNFGITGTGAELTEVFNPFLRDDHTPWGLGELKANVTNALNDHMDTWSTEHFNVKPDHWVFRMTNMMKGVQSLLMLNTLSYLTQNVVNNTVIKTFYEGVGGFMTPKQVEAFTVRTGVDSYRLSGDTGSATTMAVKNIPAVVKAQETADFMAKTNRLVRKVNNKLGIFSGLSRRMEEIQGRSAVATGYLKMWSSLWRYGKEIPTMTKTLETSLDQVAPGFKQTLIGAAQSGMNMDEIYAAIQRPIVRKDVTELITKAANALMPEYPEIIEDLATFAGYRTELGDLLKNAETPQQQQAAFTLIKDNLQNKLDMIHGNEMGNMAKEAAAKIQTEGWKAVQPIFAEMKGEELAMRLDHYKLAHEIAEQTAEMDYPKASKLWSNFLAEESRKFKRQQERALQTTAGILKGLGLDTDEARQYNQALTKYYTNFRDFFDGYDVDTRNGRRLTAAESIDAQYKRHVDGKNDILRKYHQGIYTSKNERAVARDTAYAKIKELWTEELNISKATQMQMDEIFGGMWEKAKPGEGPKAKEWRQTVSALTDDFYRELENVWDEVTATSDPAKVNKIWIEATNKIINPMLKEIIGKGEIEGFQNLIGGKYEGLVDLTPKVDGQGNELPSQPPAPTGKTEIDTQAIADEIGTHANTQKVMSEAQQQKIAAAKKSYAIMTRNQFKQQLQQVFPTATPDVIHASMFMIDLHADRWAELNNLKPSDYTREEWYGSKLAAIIREGDTAVPTDQMSQLYQDSASNPTWYFSRLTQAIDDLPDRIVEQQISTDQPERWVAPRKPGAWMDNKNLPEIDRKKFTEGYMEPARKGQVKTASQQLHQLLKDAGVKPNELRWLLPDSVVQKIFTDDAGQKVRSYEQQKFPTERNGVITKKSLQAMIRDNQIQVKTIPLGYGSIDIGKTLENSLWNYQKGFNRNQSVILLKLLEEKTKVAPGKGWTKQSQDVLRMPNSELLELSNRQNLYFSNTKKDITTYVDGLVRNGKITPEELRIEMSKASNFERFLEMIADDPDTFDEYAPLFGLDPNNYFDPQKEWSSRSLNQRIKDLDARFVDKPEAYMTFKDWLDDNYDPDISNKVDLVARENVYDHYNKGNVGMENQREILFELSQPGGTYRYQGNHYGEYNPTGWTRLGDETIDGKKWLYVHEIQSDYSQSARDEGYANLEDSLAIRGLDAERKRVVDQLYKTSESDKKFIKLQNKLQVIDAKLYNTIQRGSGGAKLKEFPNMENFQEMVLKKIMHMAATEGYEGVNFTDAAEQFKLWGSDRFEWKIEEGAPLIKTYMPDEAHMKWLTGRKNNDAPISIHTQSGGYNQELSFDQTVSKLMIATSGNEQKAREILTKIIPEEMKRIEEILTSDYTRNSIPDELNDTIILHDDEYASRGISIDGRWKKERGETIFDIHYANGDDIDNIQIRVFMFESEIPDPNYKPTDTPTKRIKITGKEQYGGETNLQEVGMQPGETIEDFATRTGRNKNFKESVDLDPSREANYNNINAALRRIGLKESQADRYALQILDSAETAGVVMPRYEGQKSAYNIRLVDDINKMLKPYGGQVETISGNKAPRQVIYISPGADSPVEIDTFGSRDTVNIPEGTNLLRIMDDQTGDEIHSIEITQAETKELTKNLTSRGDEFIAGDFAVKAKEIIRKHGPNTTSNKVADALSNPATGFNLITASGPTNERNGIRINDAMRDSIKQGMPLFQNKNIGLPKTYAGEMISKLNDVGFVSSRSIAEILGGAEPQYLIDIQNFILGQRKKIIAGQMTTRDVAKAWIETLSSQTSSGIKYITFRNALEAAMPGYELDVPNYYKYKNAQGIDFIRPEEATAAWLMSPEGKKAQANLEAGQYDPADWQSLITVRGAGYGNNPLANWLFGPNKGGKKSLADIAELTENINRLGMTQDSTALGDYTQQMIGIGRNKMPFLNHLLGFGDKATIDSREINLWLTGQGDTTRYKGPAREAIDMIKNRPSVLQDNNVADWLHGRVKQGFNEIREMGYGSGFDPRVYEHVMHHWLWDQAEGTKTTHAGMYEAMRLAQQTDGVTRKGSVQFEADGRAVIRAFKSSDITTVVHEMGHIFRRDLSGAELEATAVFGGLKNASELLALQNKYDQGTITEEEMKRYVDSEERFAYGWELYMGQKKTYIPPAMQTVFGRFTTWIQKIYKEMSTKLGIQIPDKPDTVWEAPLRSRTGNIDMEIPVGEQRLSMRKIFDGLLFDDEMMNVRQDRGKVMITRPTGAATIATGVLDANKIYNFKFKLVDLDDAIASHDFNFKENPVYPKELQNKDRASFANQTQVHENAKTLSPFKLLLDTKTLQEGPPIILPDGTIISGNGRVMYMREAKELYGTKWNEYQQLLSQNLEQYGFTAADLEGIRNPIVVRELQGEEDLVAFSKEANQKSTMGTTNAETAMDDSVIIGDDVIARLEITPDQSLSEALTAQKNIPFVTEFLRNVPQGDTAALLDDLGQPSEAGVTRVKNALFAKTYQGQAGQRMLKLFAESADEGMKRIETAMFDTLGLASTVENMIRAGQRDADLSLSQTMVDAVDMYRRIKAQGLDVEKYLDQYTIDNREAMDPFQAEVLRMVAKNSNKVGQFTDILRKYYESVLSMPSDEQGALIGEARPSKGVILDGITKNVDQAFTKAEAAKNQGAKVNMDLAAEAPTELVLDEIRPFKHGEYVINRRYQENGRDVAYLTPGMKDGTMIETDNGPARLLGLDPDDPNSKVYQLSDGEIHSTRTPADEGLYQSMYGNEKFILEPNPNDTKAIVQYYEGEPKDTFGTAAWLLPDGKYIDVRQKVDGSPEPGSIDTFAQDPFGMHVNYVEPGWGMEEGSIVLRESKMKSGQPYLNISTSYKPTAAQLESLIKATNERNYAFVTIAMESYDAKSTAKFSTIEYDTNAPDYIPGSPAEKMKRFFDDLQEGNPRELYQTAPTTKRQDIIENAKRIFGITDNYDDAGWMTPEGEMLDFKRSKESTRKEHSEIIRAINPEKYNPNSDKWTIEELQNYYVDNGITSIEEFGDMGNIRIGTYKLSGRNEKSVFMQISQKPSQNQISQILKLNKNYNLEIEFKGKVNYYDNIEMLKGGDPSELIDSLEYGTRGLYQDEPMANLFDDAQDTRKQAVGPEQPATPGETNPVDDIWKMAATHKNSKGEPDMAGLDADGNPNPDAKLKLVKLVKRWGNKNDRVAVKSFEDLTPEILDRAMIRETAYLIAQGRLEYPVTQEPAPVEGQYEDQMPANLYEGKGMDELASTYLKPMVDYMEKSMAQSNSTDRPYKVDNLPQETKDGITSWLNEVETSMANAKRISLGHGEGVRDQAMLNYSKRIGFDNLLETVFPYQFWYTRSAIEWSRRMIDNPEWIAMYARVRDNQKKMEKKGMPARLQNSTRLLAPYLEDWMGGGIFYDPYKLLFPIDNFGQPLQNFRQLQSSLEQDSLTALEGMLQDGTINQAQYDEAKTTKTGDAWMQATQSAQENSMNEAGDPMSMVNVMMTPALWWTAPYNIARGQKDKIGLMPATKQAQAFRYALQGTLLEPVGYLLGLAALPEESIRKAANMNVFGEYGNYFVDRQLSNMAADGTTTPDLAMDAMTTRTGEVYDQAVQRVQNEMAVRYPGMLPFYAAKGATKGKANFLELISSLMGAISGAGQLLPEGELRQRGIQGEYTKAWTALEQGDGEAINKFFKKYPEYRARIMSTGDPKERMRNLLVSKIWDAYGNLARPNKSLVKEQLGDEFNELFYDKTTRDYAAISIPTLTAWAMMLGQQVPITPENEAIAKLNKTQVPELNQYPDMQSRFIETYQNARDEQFPNYYNKQTAYYALPEGAKRREYLAKNPDLKTYWDWKHKYELEHPEIKFWFDEQRAKNSSTDVDLSQFDPAMLRQLLLYAFGQTPQLGPGVTSEMKNLWASGDNQAATFDDYLAAVTQAVKQ